MKPDKHIRVVFLLQDVTLWGSIFVKRKLSTSNLREKVDLLTFGYEAYCSTLENFFPHLNQKIKNNERHPANAVGAESHPPINLMVSKVPFPPLSGACYAHYLWPIQTDVLRRKA